MIFQQSAPEQITVATANTHWGRMLDAKGGLGPFAEADILLLQEVIDPDRLEARLHDAGFDLVYAVGKFGLAMAVRSGSGLSLIDGSLREYMLLRMSSIERTFSQRWAKRPHPFTERGMIAAKFRTTNGQVLTTVDVHPSVPLKPSARAIQVKKIGQELADPYYDGPLVVAGDMNHYPGPRAIDEAMCTQAGLLRVDLGKEPTWYARGSKQEKYLRIAALFQNRPIEYYDGRHDAILYRGEGLQPAAVKVMDIQSDHRAITARFTLGIKN